MYWRLILAMLWTAALLLVSRSAVDGPLLPALLAGLLASMPLIAASLYQDTIEKTAASVHFKAGSRLAVLFRSRLLSGVVLTVVGLISGWLVVFWIGAGLGGERWLLLFAPPLLFALHAWCERLLASEYRDYLRRLRAQQLAVLIGTLVIALLLAAIAMASDGDSTSLSATLSERLAAPIREEPSAAVAVLARFYDYAQLFPATLAEYLSQWLLIAPWKLTLVLAASILISCYLFLGSLAGFLVPLHEHRRVLLPVGADSGSTVPLSSVVVAATLATITTLFLWPRLVLLADAALTLPAISSTVAAAERNVLPTVVLIEGRACPADLAGQIRRSSAELLRESEHAQQLLRRQVDLAYAAAAENVDNYLDHYYSLPAEYMRLGALLTGSLEDQIGAQLREYLSQGEPFAELAGTLDRLSLEESERAERYSELMRRLYEEQCDPLPDVPFNTLETLSLQEVLQPGLDVQASSTLQRAALGGFAGLGGAIAAKVVAKVAAKGAIGVAAKSMTKVAATKAAGTTLGAAVGGVLGSVVPGAGTLVGSAAGATLGAALGVSIDALALRLEETYSREAFHTQITESLEEAKAETARALGLDDPVTPKSRAEDDRAIGSGERAQSTAPPSAG